MQHRISQRYCEIYPKILQDSSKFCQQTGKWKGFPYIHSFFYLSSNPTNLVFYEKVYQLDMQDP